MANVAGKRRRQESERKLLPKIYDLLMPVGSTQEVTVAKLVELSGISHSHVSESVLRFEKLGYIKRERVGIPSTPGFKMTMTALMDRKDAWQDLIARQPKEIEESIAKGKAAANKVSKEGRNLGGRATKAYKERHNGAALAEATPVEQEAPVVIAPEESPEETRAIAGPEKPSPLAALRPLRKADDAVALIEAAKQYNDRQRKMTAQVEQLRKTAADLGVDVDVDAVMASVKFARDEVLETVSLILPAYEAKEKQAERLTIQVAELREKANSYDTLKAANERLQKRNEALIAQRVAQAQA